MITKVKEDYEISLNSPKRDTKAFYEFYRHLLFNSHFVALYWVMPSQIVTITSSAKAKGFWQETFFTITPQGVFPKSDKQFKKGKGTIALIRYLPCDCLIKARFSG